MISLTVEAVDSGTQVYGLAASALQSDIVINEDSIEGTLNHVSEYTQFNPGDPSEQEGNFLALSFEADDEAVVETELVNGEKGPVTVNDGFCVYRITDKDQQKIRVKVTKGEESKTVEYSLNGLTCKEE